MTDFVLLSRLFFFFIEVTYTHRIMHSSQGGKVNRPCDQHSDEEIEHDHPPPCHCLVIIPLLLPSSFLKSKE